MPQIIVTADRDCDQGEGAVMLRERISLSDFESRTFAQRLVERVGWAVSDAQEAEQQSARDELRPSSEAETSSEIVEPYLLKIGFIAREPRGRRVTREAYAHLQRQPPAGGAPGQGALFE